ncbi:hypothetical protein [Dyella nitratireducens]|uniref:Uncharacterized protein n=1 Tax=Dyella nitratireducens TaxID=1849580 RepID=A0ABQ1FV99_9GAMM|nr:hypothetical protein [Dyella nitratireducens]GGA29961.1 hypothetical protein GCM10010981_18670 [Dyella nitratireducens]GLQ43069.1 hypothetical protein GCM10007902_29190 [Dyella nitratireducens]
MGWVQHRVLQPLPKFYLPYSGIDSADSVLMHGDRAMRFPSRKAALAFVMEHYRDERTAVNANQAVISIEGQDGMWRSFDTRLLPAREHS